MTPLEQALAWKEQGRIHVSPAEAAKLLQCDPTALRVSAQHNQSTIKFFRSGRNIRFMVDSLIELFSSGVHENQRRPCWIRQEG